MRFHYIFTTRVNLDRNSNLQKRPNQVLFGNGEITWKEENVCLTIPLFRPVVA